MLNKIKHIKISWGIAWTLLLAGITVQTTYSLALFGRHSFIPLAIGLCMVAVGVLFFLGLFLLRRRSGEQGK
jgi:hypothetical protein